MDNSHTKACDCICASLRKLDFFTKRFLENLIQQSKNMICVSFNSKYLSLEKLQKPHQKYATDFEKIIFFCRFS